MLNSAAAHNIIFNYEGGVQLLFRSVVVIIVIKIKIITIITIAIIAITIAFMIITQVLCIFPT